MLKRPSNYDRSTIQKMAERAIKDNGGPELARVFYKFDCGGCGSREICPDPNVLPEEGICLTCGQKTKILGAGFALHAKTSKDTRWSDPYLYVRKKYESDKTF